MSATISKQLNDTLHASVKALEEASIPQDLRVAAFEQSFQAIWSGATGGIGQSPAPQVAAPASPPAAPGTPPPGIGLVAKIAESLKIDMATAEAVYDEEDGKLILVVKSADLGANNAAIAREVALLLVVGRQAAGLEDCTDSEVVREECRELNVFDEHNFAKYMGKLEFREQGSGAGKKFKALRHHFDDAITRINKLANG